MPDDIKIESSGYFEGLTDARLLRAYNKVCGSTDAALPAERDVIIQRILRVLALQPQKQKPPVPGKRGAGRPHVRFSMLPKPDMPKRLPRPHSRRDVVLSLCRQGTTIETIMKATGATLKQAYNDVRLLHVDMGYGIREDEHGNIEVYE